MRLLLSILLLSAPLPVLADPGADFPDPPLVTVTLEGGPVRTLIAPDGSGPSLAESGAAVHVVIRDQVGTPIVGFPFQDIWLDDAGDHRIYLCRNGSMADANTDLEGHTTISGSMAAGGWTRGGLAVWVIGSPYLDQPVDISVNSPDYDGNLLVDLADVGRLGEDYTGPYEFRSDFTHDDVVNLADVGEFAVHLGHGCP